MPPPPDINVAADLAAIDAAIARQGAPAAEAGPSEGMVAAREALGTRNVPQEEFFAHGLSAREAAEVGQSGVAPKFRTMIDTRGNLVRVHESQLAAAFDSDYALASPKQTAGYAAEVDHHRTYGGIAGKVEAGASSVLSGLPFGLGEAFRQPAYAVSRALGEPGSALANPSREAAASEAENPTISTVAELGTQAALLGMGGGAGAAGGGTGSSLARLALTGSGRALEGVAGGALARVATQPMRLGTAALVKGATSALGAGAEGIGFSAAHLVNEAALGDAPTTAEHVGTELGLGLITGAGLGAFGGAIEAVAPTAIAAARKAILGAFGKAQSIGAGVAGSLSGEGKAAILEGLAEARGGVKHAAPEVAPKLTRQVVEDVGGAVDDAISATRESVVPREMAEIDRVVDPAAVAAQTSTIGKRLDELEAEAVAQKSEIEARALKEVRAELEELAGAMRHPEINPNTGQPFATATGYTLKPKGLTDDEWMTFGKPLKAPRASEKTWLPDSDIDSQARAIQKAVESSDWEFTNHGLRVDNVAIKTGGKFPLSRVWDDGTPTGELLKGTSTIEFDPSDLASIKRAIKTMEPSTGAMGSSGYEGRNVYVVGGKSVGGEWDPGEAVLKNAEVIDSWSRPRVGENSVSRTAPVVAAKTAAKDDALDFSLDAMNAAPGDGDVVGKALHHDYAIIDTKTGNAYDSIKEAADKLKIRPYKIEAQLKGYSSGARQHQLGVKDTASATNRFAFVSEKNPNRTMLSMGELDEASGMPRRYVEEQAAKKAASMARLAEPAAPASSSAARATLEQVAEKLGPVEAGPSVDAFKADLSTLLKSDVWGESGARLSKLSEAEQAFHAAREAAHADVKAPGIADALRDASHGVVDAADELAAKASKGSHVVDHPEAAARLADKSADMLVEERRAAAVAASNAPHGQSGGHGGAMGLLGHIGLGHVVGGPLMAVIGGGIAAYKTMSSAPEAVRFLARLEHVGTRIESSFARAAAAVGRVAEPTYYLGRGEVAAGISRRASKGPDETLERYERESAPIREAAADPRRLDSNLSKVTEAWEEHAPETAAALRTKVIRDTMWLASKMPAPTRAGPLSPEIPPSPDAVAKANRYLSAYHDPVREIRKAANGMLSTEGRETLQVCYPRQYAKACAVAMSRAGKSPSWHTRQAVANLLGKDIDGSRAASTIKANQAAYVSAQQREQGNPSNQPAPVVGAAHLSIAERSGSAWTSAKRSK